MIGPPAAEEAPSKRRIFVVSHRPALSGCDLCSKHASAISHALHVGDIGCEALRRAAPERRARRPAGADPWLL